MSYFFRGNQKGSFRLLSFFLLTLFLPPFFGDEQKGVKNDYAGEKGTFTGMSSFGMMVENNGIAGIIIPGVFNLYDGPSLYGGYVTNSQQTINPGQVPNTINATAATGGNCGGNYVYQWQSAPVGGSFTNISGATGQNYSPGALYTTTIFRRRTICNGDTAYVETNGTVTVINPLNGGCITSGNQVVLFGQLPSTILATAASDGNCNGNYSYQWQSSADNIYFTNIPGATLQNLSFSTPLTQTTWFQRRTTCGNEVKYTGSVKVTMTSTMTYYNVQKSGNFTRNNCAAGGTGSTVTYTVAANTYSSTTSQAAADQLAQDDVNANGQNYANANGTCTFYNTAQSGNFTRNNCGAGYTGSTVTYTIAANTYSSTVSQAAANQLAIDAVNAGGQAYANSNGTCTPVTNTFNLYYSNYTGGGILYMTLTNKSTYEQSYYELNTWTSYALLGSIEEGVYDIEIIDYYGYYRSAEAGCWNYADGSYVIQFWNVTLNEFCPYIGLY